MAAVPPRSQLMPKRGGLSGISASTGLVGAPKLVALSTPDRGVPMDLIVREFDVAFGNTKFVTDVRG